MVNSEKEKYKTEHQVNKVKVGAIYCIQLTIAKKENISKTPVTYLQGNYLTSFVVLSCASCLDA